MPDQPWEQLFGRLRRTQAQVPATYRAQLYRSSDLYQVPLQKVVNYPQVAVTVTAPGPALKTPLLAAEVLAELAPATVAAIKISRPESNPQSFSPSRHDFSFNLAAHFLTQKRPACEHCCPADIIEHSLAKTQSMESSNKLDILFIGEPGAEPIMELWEKMIVAMTQLRPFNWKLNLLGQCPVECRDFILGDIARHKPALVICFGAQATNLLLDRKLKLSQEHGKNFLCQIESEAFSQDSAFEFRLIPVFHPYFLKINPSMKRTAWDDLQKALNFLS